MKISVRSLSMATIVGIATLTLAALSCNKVPSQDAQGTLSWNFSSKMLTRAAVDLPDTDAFILTVKNSAGEVLYEGSYGDSPESMLVNPGNYTVKAVSVKFDKPEFSAPQFGDEQVVVVKAGSGTNVRLNCTQLNSGLRMRLGSDFINAYPSGTVTVSSTDGKLVYGQSENRIGYFKAGNVSVELNDGTSSKTILTRFLEPCEILTLGISCPSSDPPKPGNKTNLSISVDTSRVWNDYDFEIGSEQGADPGTSQSTAFSVGQAKEHLGEKGVWVCGYIVGGDLSGAKEGISFTPPFSSMTCIAIASRSSVKTKASCLSVKLPKGDIRAALNLADHPELLGCKVYLKGNLVAAYYGIPGIEDITDYALTKQ
ncbi:MAG TPA: hypothetical protein DD383_05700 [Rikenellaceae bacterium]|nr:hypothetical protein [Rikenellaceae bacterium]